MLMSADFLHVLGLIFSGIDFNFKFGHNSQKAKSHNKLEKTILDRFLII